MGTDLDYRDTISVKRKMDMGFEFYITIGSTFYFVPEITLNKWEIAFDFLWLHVGIIKLYKGGNHA